MDEFYELKKERLAGDFLDSLRQFAPVHAVLGNNDYGLTLPERLELEFENVVVNVIHDSGPRKGRLTRMRKLFPRARVVVFGHSHILMNE